MESQTEADQHYLQEQQTKSVVYQAASPDEVTTFSISSNYIILSLMNVSNNFKLGRWHL